MREAFGLPYAEGLTAAEEEPARAAAAEGRVAEAEGLTGAEEPARAAAAEGRVAEAEGLTAAAEEPEDGREVAAAGARAERG